MRHAVRSGATAIELDVHASADGELVVCHDTTVDRTTNGVGKIADLTLAELQALDNAYWFIPGADVTPGLDDDRYPFRGRAPSDPEFGVTTLRKVLEEFPDTVLNLDIKQSAPEVVPYEEKIFDILTEFGRKDDVIVASFLDRALDAFSALSKDIPVSAGMTETVNFFQAVQNREEPPEIRGVAFQVPERQGDLVVVDERFVHEAHRRGIAVHVWTVNDADAMERLIGVGVDGVISDVPTTLSAVLGESKVGWAGLRPR
jgi:glycerophosphoryl diester phosphodiesterase